MENHQIPQSFVSSFVSNFHGQCNIDRKPSLSSCRRCCLNGSVSWPRKIDSTSQWAKHDRMGQHARRNPSTIDSRHLAARNVPVQRTDVIVVGNGPSGICMSYMLAGHWPFYTGAAHPNEMLNIRLSSIDPQKSLLEQDLAFLSDGLEGRSSNPIALLFDALSHPDADLGSQQPSLMRWEFHPERAVPHVVLGKLDEGGIWQTVEDDIQTLSLGEWMQLPDMPFVKWRENFIKEQARTTGSKLIPTSNRASAAEVRRYYSDYVDAKGLRDNFSNHSTVTSIERVHDSSAGPLTDFESGEEDGCSNTNGAGQSPLIWEVRGSRTICDPGSSVVRSEEFCYRAPSVVLATGLFDIPNKLHVRGENQPYVLHSVAELDDHIRRGDITPHSDPVVVIGAGLSAADAILRCRAIGVPVAHVFRRNGCDPLATFRQLPPALYPDYDTVHKLMRAGVSTDGYLCYPSASVLEFASCNEVLLHCEQDTCDVAVCASYVVVLIGSRPNLSFLNGDEKQIGVVPGVAVDGKRNPIDVDPMTYQSHRRPGLYAIGPLVGDNFVRFLRGGAFGVAAHLWSERAKPKDNQNAYADDAFNT